MTELQILCAVKNSGEYIEYTELLNIDKTDVNYYPLATRDLIQLLIEQDVLSGEPKPDCFITFGKYGRILLSNLLGKEEFKKKAEENTEKERKRLVAELANEKAERKSEKQKERRFEILLMLLSALLSNLDRVYGLAERLTNWIVSLF